MSDRLDNSAPFNDDQGTKIAREDPPTGAGQEATEGTDGKPKSNSQDHKSAYGGEKGQPKLPNDVPRSRR